MAKDEKPNPDKKDNGDGTVTLTYRQTQEQKDRQAVEDKLDGKKKEGGTDMAR